MFAGLDAGTSFSNAVAGGSEFYETTLLWLAFVEIKDESENEDELNKRSNRTDTVQK